jgi:hypothetical protein
MAKPNLTIDDTGIDEVAGEWAGWDNPQAKAEPKQPENVQAEPEPKEPEIDSEPSKPEPGFWTRKLPTTQPEYSLLPNTTNSFPPMSSNKPYGATKVSFMNGAALTMRR